MGDWTCQLKIRLFTSAQLVCIPRAGQSNPDSGQRQVSHAYFILYHWALCCYPSADRFLAECNLHISGQPTFLDGVVLENPVKGAGASTHSSSGSHMLLEIGASIATMAIQVVKYCHYTRGVVQRKSGRPMVPHIVCLLRCISCVLPNHGKICVGRIPYNTDGLGG